MTDSRRIIIIGGGASGAILAAHLLRNTNSALSITIVEKRSVVGLGTAYSTDHPQHLLNVRAANMSAFADDPEHFLNWLHAQVDARGLSHGATFATRRDYGRYLNGLLMPYLGTHSARPRLRVVTAQATAVSVGRGGVAVALATGETITGAFAVLATGFEVPLEAGGGYQSPWSRPANLGLDPLAPVMIMGTGLTMVDIVLSLQANGHQGTIWAVSRRGLLPHVHAVAPPLHLDESQVPAGAPVSAIVRWFRKLALQLERDGGDWRSSVDAVRPFTARPWQSMSIDQRRRFLRHARAWWDCHRHRMAPDVATTLRRLQESGQLRVFAGRLTAVEEVSPGSVLTVRRRGSTTDERIAAARIFDCTGVSTDPSAGAHGLMHALLTAGLARPDPLSLGLDVARDLALIDAAGCPSQRLFAIGPASRAAFWEVVAVPDIRQQCAQLAKSLVMKLSAGEREEERPPFDALGRRQDHA